MRITWLTDIHLDHVSNTKTLFGELGELDLFLSNIQETAPDALFVTGDIASGQNVADYLLLLSAKINKPIYFVFGNHDFYHSSIADVRRWGREITTKAKVPLHWMEAAGVVELSKTTAAVGVDGWGDGWYGNPKTSQVYLNDWELIKELIFDDRFNPATALNKRLPKLRALGRAEGKKLREPLLKALASYERVFVLTHVPPWDIATWHAGAHSEPDWQPWFSCKAVGDVITECAAKFPETEVTVLCGHTHGSGRCKPLENIDCWTGGAAYRYPEIQQTFEI